MSSALVRTVDLNSDMGEGFGAYTIGDDEAILDVVTSANVACGLHAGDPEIMARTFSAARQRGVAVGAHPGFPDLWGFGRRVIPFSAGEIERLIAYQIGAAEALSAYAGHPVTYVKVHGALANLAEKDATVGAALVKAVKAVNPQLASLTIAHGQQDRLSREAGLPTFSEIFADRAYDEDGHLVPRSRPGAVIHDPAEAASRVARMVASGAIETLSGRLLPTPVDSICVHGDTPAAVAIAARVRTRLTEEGVAVRSFTSPGRRGAQA